MIAARKDVGEKNEAALNRQPTVGNSLAIFAPKLGWMLGKTGNDDG